MKAGLRRIAEPSTGGRPAEMLSAAAWQGYFLAAHLGARLREGHVLPARREPALGDHAPTPELFRKHITENLVPFWERHSVDEEFGGFLHHLDREGRPFSFDKFSVKQGRMVYAFSVAYDVSREPGHREIAGRGIEFLMDSMWDPAAGGWYRSSRRDGEPLDRRKFVIDQGYAILGLLEYHRVTQDGAALGYATDACELVQRHAWDPGRRGYLESCERDWSPYTTRKVISAQLAMLDAFAYLHRATGEAEHLERLLESTDIVVDRMRDPRRGNVRANFSRDWRYEPTRARGVLWVGYNLKTARFLIRTSALTGRDDLFRAGVEIVEFCLQRGWDRRHGGFFQFVYPNGLPASWKKLWWVQCEGMITLLLLYRMTGEPRYRKRFEQVSRFAFAHLVDPLHGEWFASCDANGRVLDTKKAFEWKAGFHTVQASYLVHHLLAGTAPEGSAELPAPATTSSVS